MRSGTETAFARFIVVFGSAKPYFAYLFANRRTISEYLPESCNLTSAYAYSDHRSH